MSVQRGNQIGPNTFSGAAMYDSLFHDIVVQKTFSSWDKYLKLEENSIKNKQYFDKWDCELINRDKYFWCWRVGFNNHHGINMDKHWSKRQLIQNLFII